MKKRKVEVFSAGCPLCQETVEVVKQMACPSCEIRVLDLHNPEVAQRARELGIRRAPAIAINERLVACCQQEGPSELALKEAGLGIPLE